MRRNFQVLVSLLFAFLFHIAAANAADFPTFRGEEIDPHVGNVCYAVTTADVDGDGKLDIVAVAEDGVYWYANPNWEKRVIIKGGTDRDNVCIQGHDIDGDGKVEFALGASWQPTNTTSGGTLQWLKRSPRGLDSPWQVAPIATEPTIHRLRFGNIQGGPSKQLVVAPLQGRGTKGPAWNEGKGVRILAFTIPEDPAKTPWPLEIADESLHTTHNLQLIDFDGDGRDEVVVAAWEGVFVLDRSATGLWSKTKIAAGNQDSTPFKGSSEIKVGKLGDGRRYLATIEPWHGHQVVIYRPPAEGKGLWERTVIDEPVAWGHAVWTANLDDDPDEELIIGQRDANKTPGKPSGFQGPGVIVYDPKRGSDPDNPLSFDKHAIDDGGIGCEDLVAADLNGDGHLDIVAGGRSTHNLKVYWNSRKERKE